MARHIRKPRFPTTAKGNMGYIYPCFRAPVVPGETLRGLKASYTLQSVPVANPLVGSWFEVHYFYVPLRLVDGQYPNEVSQGGYLPPANVSGTYAYSFFGAPTSVAGNYVKAYDLIVNTHFRNKELDGVHTTNLTTDPVARAPQVNMTAETAMFPEVQIVDVVVPITDDATPEGSLSLNLLTEAFRQQRQIKQLDKMDGTFVGYLEQFGVSTSDDGADFAMQPEFITSMRKWLMPSKAIDQATGNTVQSYFGTVEHEFSGRRYFKEHGYIVGVMMMRPKYFFDGKQGQFDDAFNTVWQNAYQVDQLALDPIYSLASAEWIAANTGRLDARAILYKGEQLNAVAPASKSWVMHKNPASHDQLRFIGHMASFVTDTTSLDGAHYQIDAMQSLDIATPISKPEVY